MSGDRPAARAAPATHSGCGLSFMSAELLLVFLYRATGGLVMYMIWDVFPLFCIASRSAGGLELSHEALGTLLSAAAVVQALGTLLSHVGNLQHVAVPAVQYWARASRPCMGWI
eukprot:scaffold204237_cov39-Tisochrysis_lutea.AAC.2